MLMKKNNIPVFEMPDCQATFYFLLIRHIKKQSYPFFPR